jgi:hypothetical protein
VLLLLLRVSDCETTRRLDNLSAATTAAADTANTNASDAFNPQNYCRYLQSTPEPRLLFYNRIPKTGSSSYLAMFEQNAKAHRSALSVLNFNNTYWWNNLANHHENAAALVKRYSTAAQRVVIVGHNTRPSKGLVAQVFGVEPQLEWMTTLRNCVDQELSLIFYTLLSCAAAKSRIKNGVQEMYLKGIFGDYGSPQECFKDRVCTDKFLRSPGEAVAAMIKRIGKSISLFLAGDDLLPGMNASDTSMARMFSSLDNKSNVMGHGGFVMLGLLERTSDSLELLHCALPSFSYASASLPSKNIGVGSSGSSTIVTTTTTTATTTTKTNVHGDYDYPLLTEHLRAECASQTRLYEEAERRFDAVLAMIRKQPRCCRGSSQARGQNAFRPKPKPKFNPNPNPNPKQPKSNKSYSKKHK